MPGNQLPKRYSKRRIRRRILRVPYLAQYFRRREQGRYVFERGEKPPQFGRQVPSQRAWRAFQRSTEARNAMRVARRFEEELERHGGQSYAIVADRLGVSRTMVCFHIALLRRLPADFVEWLEQEEDRAVWAYFTERRLRPVTRFDPSDQVTALGEMVDEATSEVVDGDRIIKR